MRGRKGKMTGMKAKEGGGEWEGRGKSCIEKSE